MSETLTYVRDNYEFTIDTNGTLLQEYNMETGVTTKFFTDCKEVYYPHLRMMEHYRIVSRSECESNWDSKDTTVYTLEFTTFYDDALVGLKIWYNRFGTPSSFAIGEIQTNSEYSCMKYSNRKPVLDIFVHKVEKFVSYWKSGEYYDISLFVTKITPQDKTTQQSFADKVTKNLPIL